MIETLDDIIEEIANGMGVYGAHMDLPDGWDGCRPPNHSCRSCWTSYLRDRIERAMEIERKLAC